MRFQTGKDSILLIEKYEQLVETTILYIFKRSKTLSVDIYTGVVVKYGENQSNSVIYYSNGGWLFDGLNWNISLQYCKPDLPNIHPEDSLKIFCFNNS